MLMAGGPKRPQKPRPSETRAAITELARLEKKCFGPRHKKTDFYEYLERVFDLYLMWKDRNFARKATKGVLAELYPRSVKVRKGTHPIRCIIDASSPEIDALTKVDKEAEEKKRSRWTNALRYAVRDRATVKQSGLGGFFRSNGGVAGCATEMAAILKTKKGAKSGSALKGAMKSSGP
jgi:hypothetical protein